MKASEKLNRRLMLIVAVILCIAVIASITVITVIATDGPIATVSNYQVTTNGRVNLKFKYSDIGTAVSFVAKIGNDDIPCTFDSYSKTVAVPLAPNQMASMVTVYPVDQYDKIGEGKTYSVLQYAETVLQHDEYSSRHNEVKALLNYGAYAELWQGASSTETNNGLYVIDPVEAIGSLMYYKPYKATLTPETDNKFSVGTVSLDLGKNDDGEWDIALNLSVAYSGEEALNIKVTASGMEDYIIENAQAESGEVKFTIKNINVSLFDKVYTVEVTDGTNTFKRNISVDEYLTYLIVNGEEKQADVARALLHFHGVADKAGCVHDYPCIMEPVVGTSTYQYKCAVCLKEIDTPVANEVNAYIPGEVLAGGKAPSSGNTVEVTDDGTYKISRSKTSGDAEDIWIREPYANGTQGNNGGMSCNIAIGSAKYMVVRMKSNISSMYFRIGTTEYTNLTVASQGSISSAVTVKPQDAEWTTYVIPFSVLDDTAKLNAGGNTVIDTFTLVAAVDASDEYVEIDYIAFVDNYSEIELITKDTTYQCITKKDGSAIEKASSANLYLSAAELGGNSNAGATTFSFSGADHFWLREGANPNWDTSNTLISYNGGGQFVSGGFGSDISIKSGVSYFVELYHNTDEYEHTDSKTYTRNLKYGVMDIGKARFMVIKVKSTNTSVTLKIGSTGVNLPLTSMNNQGTVITMKPTEQSTTENDETWEVFVIDLSLTGIGTLCPANADESRKIDTFSIHAAAQKTTYVEYIAFVDDWAEVDEIVTEETVTKLTAVAGSSEKVNADGTAITAQNN